MAEQEMTALLDRLIANWEDEVVEFRIGNKNSSDPSGLRKHWQG